MAARYHDAAIELEMKKKRMHKGSVAHADIDNIDARRQKAPRQYVAQAARRQAAVAAGTTSSVAPLRSRCVPTALPRFSTVSGTRSVSTTPRMSYSLNICSFIKSPFSLYGEHCLHPFGNVLQIVFVGPAGNIAETSIRIVL